MINIFCIIFFTSVWVLGIKIATSPGMILEKAGEWGGQKVREGHRIFEALLVCHYCMPSIHSIIGYSFAIGIGVVEFHWRLLIAYPIVVMGSSLFNGLVWGWHEKIKNETKYLENVEKLSHFDIRDRQKKHRERQN